jgi:hypothetical protein
MPAAARSTPPSVGTWLWPQGACIVSDRQQPSLPATYGWGGLSAGSTQQGEGEMVTAPVIVQRVSVSPDPTAVAKATAPIANQEESRCATRGL